MNNIYQLLKFLQRDVESSGVSRLEGVVKFEVFTAETMKNDVFWDVTPRGSCKNWRFGGT
jgi:hypothetical protein